MQPAVGEAAREVVSPVRANDVNDQREEILANIRKRFLDIIAQREKHIATVYEVNLSNLDFPDDMDKANTERAIQAILRDKAIAERERVTAEIKTMEMRRDLAEREGESGGRADRAGRRGAASATRRSCSTICRRECRRSTGRRGAGEPRHHGAESLGVRDAPARTEGGASPAPRPVTGAAERQPPSTPRPELMNGTVERRATGAARPPLAEPSPYDAR